MTLGSILLGFALLILIILVLLHPYLVAQRPEVMTPREQLQATKEMLLSEIRILDFDHETGTLPTDMYEPQRQALVAEAARVMQQLDALPAPLDDETELDAADEIEAAIAALRRSGMSRQALAKTKSVRVASNGRFCTECGQPVKTSDKYCAACGHKLTSDQ
jgi:hypothetical protein